MNNISPKYQSVLKRPSDPVTRHTPLPVMRIRHSDTKAFAFRCGCARCGRLLKSNEQLALTALQSKAIADEALSQLAALREANARLTISTAAARELASKAEDARQQQIRFLATIAHELRNPLAPMRTAACLLGSAGIDQPQLARIQTVIERQVRHMARLVDDLLYGSRADMGQFRIERRIIDLAPVLDAAIQMSKPAMEKRLQSLTAMMPAGPVMVNGDAERLVQVFSNLLDNASKYTPHGGDIKLSMEKSNQTVTIKTADTGIGITSQALPTIFDLFVQVPSSADGPPNQGGLGIGLAVVRSLVEAHEGHVVATSQGQDLGSEFTVTLGAID
jgi:signal transduction histidine kinase